jgi:NCAIR mutase (PurE)-related protein
MERHEIETLSRQLLAGSLSLDQFVGRLTQPRSADLGEVTLDLDRPRRCGYPEVVYGDGKSVATLEKIFHRLLATGAPVLATRVAPEKAEPLGQVFTASRYNSVARTFRIPASTTHSSPAQPQAKIGHVAVVTAGTSDLPVAEEAFETLDWMGVRTTMIHDVGVAGPHRLPAHLETLRAADAVVVIAGLEGALPSVVGGYVACPVIGVPTSVGYGTSFGGVAALLGMLNSCASNVTVVNIDAGFKGGYIAGIIAHGKQSS